MRRRAWGRALPAALVVAALAGCIAVDAPKPAVRYENDTAVAVVVRVVGHEGVFDRAVAGHGTTSLGVDECVGDGLLVETEDGRTVGRVGEPACPGWVLTIAADGSLTYEAE